MTGRAEHIARVVLGLALLAFATACVGPFGSTIERDMARTALQIEQINQVNKDTQQVIENKMNEFETRQKNQTDLVLRSLADLEQRMAAMQETLDTIRNQVDQVRYKTSGESPDRIPIPVVQGDRTTTVVLEGEQIFLDGQRALQRKDYAGARASYQEFLKQFAHSTRAAEAQLWIGETYYREGKWKEARAAYQVVEQQYLTSPRVPEALMKMALCDEKMGQNAQAAATLQRLIAKFPRWEQVEQAQEMLRSLEKGGPLVPPGPAP